VFSGYCIGESNAARREIVAADLLAEECAARLQDAMHLRRAESAMAIEDQIEAAVGEGHTGRRAPLEYRDAERRQPPPCDRQVGRVTFHRGRPSGKRRERREHLAAARRDIEDIVRARDRGAGERRIGPGRLRLHHPAAQIREVPARERRRRIPGPLGDQVGVGGHGGMLFRRAPEIPAKRPHKDMHISLYPACRPPARLLYPPRFRTQGFAQ
jgi:hypothetical protein